jgi:tetratricopeptide (TPR) repeat protein/ferredoxin
MASPEEMICDEIRAHLRDLRFPLRCLRDTFAFFLSSCLRRWVGGGIRGNPRSSASKCNDLLTAHCSLLTAHCSLRGWWSGLLCYRIRVAKRRPKNKAPGRAAPPKELPVIQPRGLRPKRPSLWRTLTLIAVHLVMIAHVAQWLLQGVTLSPLEPSEGMELAKHGLVNAGLVFFGVTILLTAVFGRFFCGWGCHLIALQDLCRWLLIKVGIRPRPLRSRLLALAPPIAFVYMFLWPAIYRFAAGETLGPVTVELTTTEFWATFPGLTVAILTFVVCGFVIVFVLGSKGFCTYGCPYGAAFGLADRLAPFRIRVTDACQGCATCTSVCTSNVRVHEEVRDHRMVVDPGCMKCLDCVANCPNDALYVGAGRPSIAPGGGGRKPAVLAWPEEILAGVTFILGFLAFRGLYGAVPFLFSLGLAATLSGLVVVLWRVLRRPDARLGSIRLKADRRLRSPGRWFVLAMVPVLVFWAHSSVVQGLSRRGHDLYDRTADLRRLALDLNQQQPPLAIEQRELVGGARRMLTRLERWSPIDTAETDLDLAWLALLEGDLAESENRVDGVLRAHPGNADAHLLAARLLVHAGRFQDASRAYTRVIELDPSNELGYLGLGAMLGQTGQLDAAYDVFARGLVAAPDSVNLRYNAGLSLALAGDFEAAVGDFREVLERDPDHLQARENMAGALAAAGRFDEAIPVFEEAIRRSPEDPQLRLMAARACLAGGRRHRAEEHIDAAVRIDPSLEPARSLLD